jgi:hypothetical protein
LVCKFLNFAL